MQTLNQPVAQTLAMRMAHWRRMAPQQQISKGKRRFTLVKTVDQGARLLRLHLIERS